MEGVSDQEGESALNWIRSGTYEGDESNPISLVFSDLLDTEGQYEMSGMELGRYTVQWHTRKAMLRTSTQGFNTTIFNCCPYALKHREGSTMGSTRCDIKCQNCVQFGQCCLDALSGA